jgi:hypothetical protein
LIAPLVFLVGMAFSRELFVNANFIIVIDSKSFQENLNLECFGRANFQPFGMDKSLLLVYM